MGLRATLPALGCAACGGVWLGPDASVHVMRGLGDQLEAEVASASEVTARASLNPVQDSGARPCVQCANLMTRLVVKDVTVDTCAAHGTWFDRGEIAGVVAACNQLRRQQTSEADDPITAAGVVEGAGAVVSSIAGLAWGGLVNVIDFLVRQDRDRDRFDAWGRPR